VPGCRLDVGDVEVINLSEAVLHYPWPLPAFPNARYVVHESDWAALHQAEVQAHFPFSFVEETISPLQALGVLELVGGQHAVTDEVTLVPAPGRVVREDGRRYWKPLDLNGETVKER
jgi:hypothetical protein